MSRLRLDGPGPLMTGLVLASIVTAAPLAGFRQASPTAPPSQQQAFRGRIDAVSVDAVVTNKQGEIVTDLTAADFEVKERGKAQTVETFKFVQVGALAADAPTPNAIRSDEDVASQARRDDVRLFVVFLDDYHVQRTNSEKARDRVARLMSEISPRDLVAIMYPLTNVSALAFSHDRAPQETAIKNFVGRKYDYTAVNPVEENYQCAVPQVQERIRAEVTYSALASLSAYLGTLTDLRKTVVFVSEGPTGPLPSYVRSPAETRGCEPQSTGPDAGAPAPGTLQPRYIKAAIENNVAMYPVDPRGTTADDFDMRNTMQEAATSRATVTAAHESLRNLAAQTGGRAIVNVNEYDDLLRQVPRDASAYYLLGYTSSLGQHDGQFHEISMKVKRPGLEVRARPGYWAWDEAAARAAASKPEAPNEVKTALGSLAARPDAAVRLWTGTSRGAAGRTDLTVVWEATAHDASRPVDHVAVKLTSGPSRSSEDAVAPADHGPGLIGGQVTLHADPGPATVHVVAFDASNTEIDTEQLEVSVPDLTGTAPSISTPQIFVVRTPHDLQLLRAASLPRPSALREFAHTDRLVLRFAVSGPSGAVPPVTLRILDKNGKSLVDFPAPTARADGTFEAELSLGWAAAGQYLIEVRAAAESGTASALVPFTIGG